MAVRSSPATRVWLVLGLMFMRLAAADDTAGKVRRANELMESDRPADAIPLYRELSAAFPGVPSFGLNLALAQYRAGLYRDSIAQCTALLRMRPDILSAWVYLGAAYLEVGEPASAVEPFEKAVALDPEDAHARTMLAGTLLRLERYAEAAPEFEAAARLAPEAPRVWYGMAGTYEGLAGSALDRLAPESAAALAVSGYLESHRRHDAPAVERFRRALAADPSFRGLHAAIAEVYDRAGRTDWALLELAKEPAAPPDCDGHPLECEFAAGRLHEIAAAPGEAPETLYWRARAWLDLSRRAYGRLDELPPSPEKYEAAARRAEDAGLDREAADAWRRALELSPADTGYQRRLAEALCRANDYRSALPLLRKLLLADRTSAELNYLYGAALAGMQDPAQALPYLEYAVKRNSSYLPARAALGQAYLSSGEPGRAIPELEAALSADEDGSSHHHLARAYESTGRKDQAAAAFRAWEEIESRNQARHTLPPPEP